MIEKICENPVCQQPFTVSDEDLAFLEKVSPVFDGTHYDIPPPRLCPHCRLQRRMAHRNHTYVYKGVSCTDGASIMSMFPEDTALQIMDTKEWWEDRHDPLAHGRDFSSNDPFFAQFAAVFANAPLYARSVLALENSDYCNNASYLKNSYLVFNTSYAEDSFSCETIWHTRDCIDCTQLNDCELCYDCTLCNGCYNLQSSSFSEQCSDSAYLAYCQSCTHCFGCANLSHKEYCFFNEQLTKEAYEERLANMDLSSWTQRREIEARVRAFWVTQPRPHAMLRQAEGSSGNVLTNTRNVRDSFFVWDAENVRYGFNVLSAVRDCMDYTLYGDHAELLYECVIVGDRAYHLLFCSDCWDNVANLLYCQFCVSCKDCFGCSGLHGKQYCILNRQYTKEEYEALVPQIITHMQSSGEWGEFFPIEASPYPYNHTLAGRYFPLQKDQVERIGLRWYDRDVEEISMAIEPDSLPDGLPSSDDPIIVKSLKSGRPFKITTQELRRYRQLHVPLPRLTYDERMAERSHLLGGITLFERTCANTGKPMLTTIAPDEPWIVWDREEWERTFRG